MADGNLDEQAEEVKLNGRGLDEQGVEPMNPTRKQQCRLCGASDLRRQDEVSIARIERDWKQYFSIDVGRFFDGQPVLTAWRCKKCGLVQYTPAVCGDGQLYSQLQAFDWYYQAGKWEHTMALRVLKAAGVRRVLEIGSGRGAFLAALKQEGFLATGLELNTVVAQDCRSAGLDVRDELIQDFVKTHDAEYDAVCCFQVLEHVDLPIDLLRGCCQALSKGGLLLLGVPQSSGILGLRTNVLNMPPHHLTKWAPRVMRSLPSLLPVRLVEQKTEPLAEYHVDAFLDMALGPLSACCPSDSRVGRSIRWRAGQFIRRFRLNRWIKGECLFACFRKE